TIRLKKSKIKEDVTRTDFKDKFSRKTCIWEWRSKDAPTRCTEGRVSQCALDDDYTVIGSIIELRNRTNRRRNRRKNRYKFGSRAYFFRFQCGYNTLSIQCG